MDLTKEINNLSKILRPDNLDSCLSRLFDILKIIPEGEASQIMDFEIDNDQGFEILSKKHPLIFDFINKAHETILNSDKKEETTSVKENNEIEKAIILVGGKATRLRPLTYIVPKPLIPINGKTLTEHVMDIAKKHGIMNIILAIGHKGEIIKEYFKDGSKFGVNIEYTEEKEPLGTAGPLLLIDKAPKKPFLMINGDNLFDIDITEMFSFFKRNNAIGVIALTPTNNPLRGGCVKMDGDKIVRFCEKLPIEEAEKEIGPPPYWLSSGYYILSPEVFDFVPKEKRFTMMEKDIFPKLAETQRLFGFKSENQWHDSGTPERYQDIINRWKISK